MTVLAVVLLLVGFGASDAQPDETELFTGPDGTPLPNILYILLDDFGWADASWHHPSTTELEKELGKKKIDMAALEPDLTPNMDSLIKEGIELDRHYVYKFCSPTRSAIQTGRNPIHVNVLNIQPSWLYNPDDPVSGMTEIPRDMTGIAEKMSKAGYETHFYGKWHAGMATKRHTPRGRGYQKALHYFSGVNDYWTANAGPPCMDETKDKKVSIADLWDGDGPAKDKKNPSSCSQNNQDGCVFEDEIFYQAVVEAIQRKPSTQPLFIFWSPHIAHVPYQLPKDSYDMFSDPNGVPQRGVIHAMIYWVDQKIGQVHKLLLDSGLWENTLLIVHSDNGGAIWEGSNNYPLKGGKRSNWEGGIRVNAFVSGGFLPAKARGRKLQGAGSLMAAWDWYSTFCNLAGVDPKDDRAEASGLPGIDSYNMWPYLIGETSQSPRGQLMIGDQEGANEHLWSNTKVGGVIKGRYKVLLGSLSQSGWTGPEHPNKTVQWDPQTAIHKCGDTVSTGCMFDIYDDPTERVNIAKDNKELFEKMLAAMKVHEGTAFSPFRGKPHPDVCSVAVNKYGGFWGPFVDEDDKKDEKASLDILSESTSSHSTSSKSTSSRRRHTEASSSRRRHSEAQLPSSKAKFFHVEHSAESSHKVTIVDDVMDISPLANMLCSNSGSIGEPQGICGAWKQHF